MCQYRRISQTYLYTAHLLLPCKIVHCVNIRQSNKHIKKIFVLLGCYTT